MDTKEETEGKHYRGLSIDPYRYCTENGLNPYQFNAIKYVTRYNLKNGIQDLEKAVETIKALIEYERGKEK